MDTIITAKNPSKLFHINSDNFHDIMTIRKEIILPEHEYRDADYSWCKINNKWYYVKNNIDSVVRELLGEKITKHFNLNAAKVIPGIFEGLNENSIISLSEYFRNNNYSYHYLFDIIDISCKDNYCNNLELLERDLNNYIHLIRDTKKLLYELYSLIVRDYYVGEYDRHYHNFLIMDDQKELRLAPVFDNESSFSNKAYQELFNGCFLFIPENILYYIKCYPPLEEIIDKFFSINIKQLINDLEEEYEIKIGNSFKSNVLETDKHNKTLLLTNLHK